LIETKPETVELKTEPETAEHNAGNVLIIDDDSAMVEVLTQMLVEEGYRIDSFTSGVEGIKNFGEQRHEVVLTDLRIGDMSGIDVLRSIKEINPQSAVIILTGYASTETAVEAVRLGANDYLTKPIRMLDLIKSVRNQMSSVRLANRVTELNKAVSEERDKLRRSIAELALLKRLAERMVSILSFVEGFEVILSLLVEEVEADIAVIYNIDKGTARFSSSEKPSLGELKQLTEIINRRGEDLLSREIGCRIEDFPGVDKHQVRDNSRGGLLSTIVVPLQLEERSFGLLVAASRKDERFEAIWLDFIAKLSRDSSEFLTRIKRSVERQRHFTTAVVEHTADGIAVIDPTGGEVLFNPVARSMLELPPGATPSAEDVEKRLDFKIDEIWEELAPDDGNEAKQRGNVLQRDITLKNQTVFYRLNLSVLPSDESEKGLLLVVIHDVTKERSVEEMKKRLISNITHEVRTPTGVIKEFIALIEDGVAGELNDAQRQYVNIMHTNIDRLQRLIENLLNMARMETGGFTLVLKPTELKPIVETIVASMEVKLTRKNIGISVDLPAELPFIYADRDAVIQILTNLVDNAFKYSSNDTNINISALDKGARIEVLVADQGYGIAPADQEAIFTRFHRLVDQDDPRFQEGVGLGLALVKDLVTRHGGDIWVESKEGKGSIFHFTLQVATEDEEHRPA